MHFSQHSASDNYITARFPNPKLGNLSPSNVSISTYRTPESINEALARSDSLSMNQQHSSKHSSKHSTPARQGLERSESSSYWMEIRKSPTPQQKPRSRKITDATIRTEATETEPAFESDAFAIHMPTTREPILDAPIFRAKLPSPSKAQLDAYQTYKVKGQEMRDRQQYEGVRVPSKIASYDYAYRSTDAQPSELEVSPPNSPPIALPAGAFPITPPTPHQEWKKNWEKTWRKAQDTRAVSDSSHISIPRKPVGVGSIRSNHTRPQYHRADASTGAIATTSQKKPATPPPSATKPTIRIRIKPKIKVPSPSTTPSPSHEPAATAKEPLWSAHSRLPHASNPSSANGSKDPSPTKSNFTYAGSAGTSVFGYTSHDITGTVAGASRSTQKKSDKEREKEKEREKQKDKDKAKEKPISRWAWLRPAGPRVNKPTAVSTASATPATTAKAAAYVDPFVLHATPAPTLPNTPTTSRPSSPKKLVRGHTPTPSTERAAVAKGKFESGFAQIQSLTSLILKICLLIYVLVGLYFLLDAVREAVHALGAPFRAVKLLGWYLWIGGAWAAELMLQGWQRWGVNIKLGLKGGWRGRWW
ncbi:hypothetical protein BU24DRAFT_489434 [Aaosphaeria arxii CBS 175.79]|uniref:Uncharacterized protein n=1 Tax=Aaosphaeria arxii CBS 175.79 TaxID=1450172 RepID=A0A6A5Y2L9_9PLEO|nr:uncharacterized protein BU24DRAFT_489434 [Aaosphaeria arxii CBS 175.79]KAF2019473.1 hypothetical protein BU24DRAFT_489434 [Aaosphaeria arxii CBS 175.79]